MSRSQDPLADPVYTRFGANEVQLTPRQWAIAGTILALLLLGLPAAWKWIEPLATGPDYRLPYALANDYWTYDRYCDRACAEGKTLVIGDSVIWGHYVTAKQTLSHYLNQRLGGESFANLGVDGTHPAALAGLVEYYGRAIHDRRVILHCNLLWISSNRHDLQTDKSLAFNHPTLVPQFFPRIPCYRESVARKLGIVIGRRVSFLGWAEHLRIAYFDSMTLPRWTLRHPYQNPLAAMTGRLPSPDALPTPRPVAKPWTEQAIGKFNPHWVELSQSFQWASFRRVVAILKQRHNTLLVVVGPFNEHMLRPAARTVYRQRRDAVAAWLRAEDIPHCVPATLASRSYADASHPLADGYAQLARQLTDDRVFRATLTGDH